MRHEIVYMPTMHGIDVDEELTKIFTTEIEKELQPTMQHKEQIAARKEQLYHETVKLIRENKFAHCTTVMVTEARMNDLKRAYLFAKVPYGGDGKCFMFCK